MEWPRDCPWNHPVQKLNFSWVDDMVAGCEKPSFTADRRWLIAQGISALVAAWEDNVPPSVRDIKHDGIVCLRLRVPDFQPPEMWQITEALEFIRSQVSLGNKVAVACGYGEGRTGVFLTCYLMASGRTMDEALMLMKRLERVPYENGEQLDRIREYYDRLRSSEA